MSVKKKIIVFGVLTVLVIVGYIIQKQPNDFQILQSNAIHGYTLIEDSQKKIEISEDLALFLVSDVIGNVHVFLLDKNKLITTDIIFNVKVIESNENENDIHWTAYDEKGKYFIFVGALSNKKIKKISINNLNEGELSYLEYEGYKMFYTTKRIETPFLIKGFSIDNELIYKNYQ